MRKKQTLPPEPDDEMLDEYDFTGGVRGKYVERFKSGSNIVLLSPDVAKVFHDSEAVNEALRTLIRLTQQEKKVPA